MHHIILLFFCKDTAMELYLRALKDDEDKETVAQACSSIAEILPQITYSIIEQCKEFSSYSFLYLYTSFKLIVLVFSRYRTVIKGNLDASPSRSCLSANWRCRQ